MLLHFFLSANVHILEHSKELKLWNNNLASMHQYSTWGRKTVTCQVGDLKKIALHRHGKINVTKRQPPTLTGKIFAAP